MNKFFKLSWGYRDDGKERFAIVSSLSDSWKEKHPEYVEGIVPNENSMWATFIYGSNRGCDKKGTILFFSNIKEITEISPKEIGEKYFVELL